MGTLRKDTALPRLTTSVRPCCKVAVHFHRVALTRAKARVLRDALGIDLVAVEELADE
jgi:hypothetical protein